MPKRSDPKVSAEALQRENEQLRLMCARASLSGDQNRAGNELWGLKTLVLTYFKSKEAFDLAESVGDPLFTVKNRLKMAEKLLRTAVSDGNHKDGANGPG